MIAEALLAHLPDLTDSVFAKVEIAGPGFINLFLKLFKPVLVNQGENHCPGIDSNTSGNAINIGSANINNRFFISKH